MKIAENYFSRYFTLDEFVTTQPSANLSLVIVIPCFSEPDILLTLDSLLACEKPKGAVEVLVVVNYSELATIQDKEYNQNTYNAILAYAKEHQSNSIGIHAILAPDLPKKHAGVGFARKIGMDEAVRRFEKINNEHGIIAAFDSDSLAPSNYMQEVENYFRKNSKCGVATVHYEHPLVGDLQPNMYAAIAQYELHLRIYVAALASMSFPYPYHTVGSSMLVTNKAYCKQGGMNRRQAGEDFYFLHKLFQTETTGHIGTTMVIPSSRISHRVPFGTGHAMQSMLKEDKIEYLSYHPDSYKVLTEFFLCIEPLFNGENIEKLYATFHKTLQDFISLETFQAKVKEVQKHSTDIESYTKRFFAWFNGFMIFRYLNEAHISFFLKMPIQQAASLYLQTNESVEAMLLNLRSAQKQNGF